MPNLLTFEDVIARVRQQLPAPRSIAIDGLPCAGKTTLADQLSEALGLPVLYIDDFVVPRDARPPGLAPAFPFPHFRLDDFRAAVREVAGRGRARYHPFDWSRRATSPEVREIAGPCIVEGCSVLSPELAPLFDVRFWVQSDESTMLAAQRQRDGDVDADAWRDLYIPSVELYMRTEPWRRADHLVAGRGITPTV